MDPEIGKWMRKEWGEDSGRSDTGGRGDTNPLKLKDLAHKLLKESKEEVANITPRVLTRFFTADSVMHFMACPALRALRAD